MELELKKSPHTHHQYSEIPNAAASDSGNTHIGSPEKDHHTLHNSFAVAQKDVLRNHNSSEKKLQWLRSQIIGTDAEFTSPFGQRLITYADHTASGRSLRFIEQYLENDMLPFYGNTHTSDSYVGDHTTKMVHEASNYVKKCLGGTKDDALIFCGSGSTAAIKRLQEVMGIAVPSILRERVLKSLKDEERWVVFVSAYEHHSNVLSWRQSLAEVVEIGLDSHGLIDMDSLKEKLKLYSQQKRPILGSFSACSNVTGICTDTRAIARLIHHFGGFACFDFAASGPYAKIDMRSNSIDGYDAVFLSTHKFVGGPGTPGVLLMRKSLYKLQSSPPSTCGGGTVNYVNGYSEQDTLYIDDIEEREDAGTPAIISKARAALAFWVKEYIGYETIEKKEQIHIHRAISRLLPNENIHVLGNTTVERQAILSFIVYSNVVSTWNEKGPLDLWNETRGKPLHGAFVAKLLNDLFGIQARGGCACAGPYGHILLDIDQQSSLEFRSIIEKGYNGIKPGWTRVGFPYYMSEEQIEFIVDAIEFIGVYGQRFMSLYRFSWSKGSWSIKKELKGFMSENMQAKLKEDVSSKYKSYMETAHRLAKLLPKFPTQGKIPSDVDIDVVPFLV